MQRTVLASLSLVVFLGCNTESNPVVHLDKDHVWCMGGQCDTRTSLCCGTAVYETDDAGVRQDIVQTWNSSCQDRPTTPLNPQNPCGHELSIGCDGPEDCPSGQQCCVSNVDAPSGYLTTVWTNCGSTCPAPLGIFEYMYPAACHTSADCPSQARLCCFGAATGGAYLPPLGFCFSQTPSGFASCTGS